MALAGREPATGRELLSRISCPQAVKIFVSGMVSARPSWGTAFAMPRCQVAAPARIDSQTSFLKLCSITGRQGTKLNRWHSSSRVKQPLTGSDGLRLGGGPAIRRRPHSRTSACRRPHSPGRSRDLLCYWQARQYCGSARCKCAGCLRPNGPRRVSRSISMSLISWWIDLSAVSLPLWLLACDAFTLYVAQAKGHRSRTGAPQHREA